MEKVSIIKQEVRGCVESPLSMFVHKEFKHLDPLWAKTATALFSGISNADLKILAKSQGVEISLGTIYEDVKKIALRLADEFNEENNNTQ